MLGHRGVRLGITYPEITEMQARAILEAAARLNKEGLKIVPEIMIPLVGLVKELQDQKVVVDRVAAEVMKEQGIRFKYLVGTMIEVPRGALTADAIAAHAQFFSFGTNDLTQMTFGFSRDDVGVPAGLPGSGRFSTGSVTLTAPAPASSWRWPCRRATTRPDLKPHLGEHGDPRLCTSSQRGPDYVSASPTAFPSRVSRPRGAQVG
jgi:pyruvate,orthophosphate dikinase